MKIVLDFAMSDLATRYLFNGSLRLKDLSDEVMSIVLNNHHAEFVLDNWSWSNVSFTSYNQVCN